MDHPDTLDNKYKNVQIFEVDDSFNFQKDNCFLRNRKGGEPYEQRLFTCHHHLSEYAASKGLKLGDAIIIEGALPQGTKEKEGCTQSGIWLLSYLSSQGYVELDDDIWSDYLSGILKKRLPGILGKIPVGSQVYILFDACREKVTAHWKLQEAEKEAEEEDYESCWWENIPKEQIIETYLSWTFV